MFYQEMTLLLELSVDWLQKSSVNNQFRDPLRVSFINGISIVPQPLVPYGIKNVTTEHLQCTFELAQEYYIHRLSSKHGSGAAGRAARKTVICFIATEVDVPGHLRSKEILHTDASKITKFKNLIFLYSLFDLTNNCLGSYCNVWFCKSTEVWTKEFRLIFMCKQKRIEYLRHGRGCRRGCMC